MLLKLLYKLDLYAPPFPLRFKKKRNYKSKIGMILGIFTIILFFYFFLDGIFSIISRETYFIVEESNYINNPKTNFSHIPILVHLQNINGDDYTFNSSIFNISLSLMIYKDMDNIITETKENIPLVNCNNKFFLKEYFDFYDNYSLNEYLCPDYNKENFLLEGDFSEGGIIKYLSLEISVCNNNNCIDLNNIEEIINNIKFVLYIKINDPSYKTFKNPIKTFYKNFQIRLSNSQSKDFKFFFYQKNFTSDNGLIISKIIKYSLFDFDSLQEESLEFNNKYFFKANFYSTNKFIEVNRSYKKLIEMFGEIGGTCSTIFSVLNIINSYLLRNFICEDIINILIEKNNEIRNEKINYYGNLTKNNNSNLINNKNINESHFSSKSEKVFFKNYLTINQTIKNFSLKKKITLNWKYHIFPLEYCTKKNEKFKLHKNYIYSLMSLEKIFEINTIISILKEFQKINKLTLSKLNKEKKFLNINMNYKMNYDYLFPNLNCKQFNISKK